MSETDGKPDTKDSSSAKADEQRFWRALQKEAVAVEAKPIELTEDLSHLSAREQENRLQALRSMLAASEARQQEVLQRRLPTLESGVRIGVKSGPFENCEGTVKDADFIHNRVLLEIDGENDLQWISFKRLAPIASV